MKLAIICSDEKVWKDVCSGVYRNIQSVSIPGSLCYT